MEQAPGGEEAGSAMGERSQRPWREGLLWQLRRLARAMCEILYGMTVYDMVRDLRKERGNLERLFVALTFGDLLGIPILPTYHGLRLLPYVAPHLQRWRRSMLRERDLTDLCDQGLD